MGTPRSESELPPQKWEMRYKRSRQYQRYIVDRLRNSEAPRVEGRRQQRQLPGA